MGTKNRADLTLPSGTFGVITNPIDTRFTMLDYGAPGTAKTPFVTCVPQWMWPVLYVSLDSGADTLNSVFRAHKVVPAFVNTPIDKDGLPQGAPSNDHPWNMIPVACPQGVDMWDWIYRVLTWPGWAERLGIRYVVVDGLSTFGKSLLINVAQAQFFTKKERKGEAQAQVSVGEEAPLFVPQPGDYGAVQNALVTIRDLALATREWHVSLVMHQEAKKISDDGGDDQVLYGPQTVGSALMQSFAGEFNQVLHHKRIRAQAKGGATRSDVIVELEQRGKWPARLRREPGKLSKPYWKLDWHHYRFWQWAADEIDLQCSRDFACEAYAEMPVGPFQHPDDEE